ncbi:MAG: hypothetical protein DRN95_05610 [Candidatus Hydrothermarchaeota archaeon]|nr:MAG: hypothetical protein DRN95_05610 [Candidatus Hydrothermarchaeota archaeon]
MPRWRWGHVRKGRGRPLGELFLHSLPEVREFIPRPCLNPEPIELTYPEYNVIVLMDIEKLSQEEAAEKMGTSRGTIWRLYQNAREKIARALKESRPLIIIPKGKVTPYSP